MLVPQRPGEVARYQAVDDLDGVEMPRGLEHVEERLVDGQRGGAAVPESAGGRLADQLGRAPVRVGGVDAVDVLDDNEATGAESVGDEECPGVGPVQRDAPGCGGNSWAL